MSSANCFFDEVRARLRLKRILFLTPTPVRWHFRPRLCRVFRLRSAQQRVTSQPHPLGYLHRHLGDRGSIWDADRYVRRRRLQADADRSTFLYTN